MFIRGVLILTFACVARMPAQTGAAAAGKAIFEGKGGCVRCHSVANRGGSLGPDLSEIGVKRTPESLGLSITDPNSEIDPEYVTVVVSTKQGQRVEGIGLNEDDVSIQLRDPDGNPRSFLKADVAQIRREERSLMPSYASKLSPGEIEELVVWLRTLRGGAPPIPQRREPGPLTRDITWLTRANRDSQERPDTLLDNVRIPRGATVADLGAGVGYFTWRLAQRVGPQGKVIAVDIQRDMLDRVAQEVKKRSVSNVELVLGTERDPHLPEAAVDLVLIANAYHELSQPEAILAAVRRSLKPNGRVVVIEYSEENDEDRTVGLYTMTFDQLRSEIEPAGFELDRVLDMLPLQHALIFTKTQ